LFVGSIIISPVGVGCALDGELTHGSLRRAVG
jgi:hypothetical protein